jgi:hypothetical protein
VRPAGELLQPVPDRASPRRIVLRRGPPSLFSVQRRHPGIRSGADPIFLFS